MKTVLQIIEEAGGWTNAECISIENEPWMRLVIEVLPERGPDGRTVVSVAHYGEQNSDAMRDPVTGPGDDPHRSPPPNPIRSEQHDDSRTRRPGEGRTTWLTWHTPS